MKTALPDSRLGVRALREHLLGQHAKESISLVGRETLRLLDYGFQISHVLILQRRPRRVHSPLSFVARGYW